MENPELATGGIEVMVNALEILSEAKTPPFVLDAETDISETIRLKYRYLDLRRAELQRNIILRSRVAAATREYFLSKGFLEVERPCSRRAPPRARGTTSCPAA
jgi:aspartyl-tRNA synthetase